jgi:RNA polymerase sigma factor (sigma-70 family)
MVNGRTSEAIRQVSRLFEDGTLAGMPDVEILGRFVDRRDEAAFELLLRRHGPMVLNVCRQALFDPDEVEDAFQATFLVLISKAGGIRVEGSLGPWLYRVASRISARARANRRRRREREVSPEEHPEPSFRDDPDRMEIPGVMYEELGRLPERLRAPLVLCYLEGMTHELAASELRCPVGTVRSRLARARALLQKRIARRGIAIPAAALAAMLESSSRAAALPPQIPRSLITLATRFASGSATIGGGAGVSASVAALMEGVLIVMRVKKLASLAAAFVAVGTLAVVVGTTSFPAAGQTDENPTTRPAAKFVVPPSKDSEKPTPQVQTYVKTYYVGDLVGPISAPPGNAPATTRKDRATTDRRRVDLAPLVDLITSTVAPGSWSYHDDQGKDITSEYYSRKRTKRAAPSKPIGAITPFYLGISLIIRCTAEVHEDVANLLRGLRRLQSARENPEVVLEEEEAKLGIMTHPIDPKPADPQPTDAKAVTPTYVVNPVNDHAIGAKAATPTHVVVGQADELRVLFQPYEAKADIPTSGTVAATSNNAKPADPRPDSGKAVVPPSQDQRARIQQLLDALRQEVEKLPKDGDAPFRTHGGAGP